MSTTHKMIHRESGDKSQLRAFRKAARELGCDPGEKRFQDALRKVAKAKPPKKGDESERRGKDRDA
jgi:hypothetical protein